MAHRTVKLCVLLVAVTAIGFAATSVRAAKATLTVYTAVEADDLKKYAARFNEDHPDIEIKWVRDSTGVITAKLLAEKANPQADVIWGLAATSLLVLKPEGCSCRTHRRVSSGSTRSSATRTIRRHGSAWTRGSRPSASTRSRPRRRICPSRRRGRT